MTAPRLKAGRPPKVYAAISAITAELARTGIPKDQVNPEDQYQFRGIDDLYNRLAPLLAKQKLCILPRMLERESVERQGAGGELLLSVSVKAAFDLVSARDGSVHVIEAYGEALDGGDKATAKAMTAAFKSALFQAFCIPVIGEEDADARTHKLKRMEVVPQPDQGWDAWFNDMLAIVRVCESGEALDRLQNTYRSLFRSISAARPELYAALGNAIRDRRQAVSSPSRKSGARQREQEAPQVTQPSEMEAADG